MKGLLINTMLGNDNICCLLITFKNSLDLDQMLDLIRFQTVWHSDATIKEFLQKKWKKNQQMTIKHANLHSMQRVIEITSSTLQNQQYESASSENSDQPI